MNKNEQETIGALYRDPTLWAGEKTMEHSSGIWGRVPTLNYLKKNIIKPGQQVLDFGCGAGYPTAQMALMVGENGWVGGLDSSMEMLREAEKNYQAPNLRFYHGDLTHPFPFVDDLADVATSFMVCHNLRSSELQKMLNETRRVLKSGGHAVFLTMHPEALDSDWDLDFMVYDPKDIQRYRAAFNADKEDIQVPGVVKNVGGGSKKVMMFHHTWKNTIAAIQDAGLEVVDEIDLWIDEAAAKDRFGPEAVRVVPTTPTFWMIVMKK